jgi:hypothetical protein
VTVLAAESTGLVLADLFHAPSTDGALDHLLSFRESIVERIHAIAGFTDSARTALGFFLEGAKVHAHSCDRYGVVTDANELLNEERAIAALDAHLWKKAMDLTDVYDCMPQARRDEWNEQIQNHKTPPFTKENVAATFDFLLSSRSKFFAERVDGIFQSLSRRHVTNQPEGFGKRMILSHVLSEFGKSPDYRRAGTINDLRCVIARFMGRDEPAYAESDRVIRIASEQPGKWTTIDGGALRLRVYTGACTGHLEVHPDMAWRLNAVLASLHPAAIPSQFREAPTRKTREFKLMQRPLPFAVLSLLRCLVPESQWAEDPKRCGGLQKVGQDERKLVLSYSEKPDKAQRKRLDEVLSAIGGVDEGDGWRFDYNPREVLDEILCSGCIPDEVSHQYYPTPDDIARAAIEAAQIGPDDECLEPSAGLGAIADLLPAGKTQCVEINAIHCTALRAKGHEVVEADFLAWNPRVTFDRIVMNPPYSEGRWQAHLEHAASLLEPGGRLVAILPESARKRRLLPNMETHWGEVYRFPGTSISVSILVAQSCA